MANPGDLPAIDLQDVAKTYARRVHALRGIAMRVERGEVFGLLGPNGAGKSTLVKIMMTAVRPNRAAGTILGRPIGYKPALERVGYLPENHHFPGYLTGRNVLHYYAALAKVDRPTRRRRADELLELVELRGRAQSRVRTYSKGMQQRLGLAQAMMNDPDLLVLDEPTDGLDPLGQRDVREILGRLREQGKTVFLNSHQLGEVEKVCDRVAILVQGKVVHQGTIDDLAYRGHRYEIAICGSDDEGAADADVRNAMRAAMPCELQPAMLPQPADGQPADGRPADGRPATAEPVESGVLPSGVEVELCGNKVRLNTTDPAAVQPLIDAFRAGGLVIRSVAPVHQSLEDFFIQAVSGPTDSPAAAGPATEGGPR